MSNRTVLYVTGFNPNLRARDLAYEFERFGRLVRCDIPALKSSSSNPFAFVEFRREDDAEDAYYDMHGRSIDGRRITVQWAKRPPSAAWRHEDFRRDGGRGEGGRGGDRDGGRDGGRDFGRDDRYSGSGSRDRRSPPRRRSPSPARRSLSPRRDDDRSGDRDESRDDRDDDRRRSASPVRGDDRRRSPSPVRNGDAADDTAPPAPQDEADERDRRDD